VHVEEYRPDECHAGSLPGVWPVVAESFWGEHSGPLSAAITVLVAIVAARIADRALSRQASARGGLSPVADTRLRLLRRLVFVAILVIGVLLALSQFEGVRRMAAGILASSAVLGLVVGFASRQVLANAVAGTLLAITQPIRIGDLVTFEDSTGTVEDMRLTYTYLRAGDGTKLIIPNERLAQNTIANHTLGDPRVRAEASVWIAPEADADRALELIRQEPGLEAEIVESAPEGIRISASRRADEAGRKGAVEAEILAACLRRLRSDSLSSKPAS